MENTFKVGDKVREKGTTEPIMEIISNQPSGGLSIDKYLQTDKYICEWTDNSGKKQTKTFSGIDLEVAE